MKFIFNFLSNYRWIILIAGILKWTSFHMWVVHDWLGIPLSFAIRDSLASNILLVCFCFVLSSTIMHYIPSSGKFWYALALSFFFSWLWQWTTHQALIYSAGGDTAYLSFLDKAVPIRWSIGFLVITGISIASLLYDQLKEQKETSAREAATSSMVREAELQKLQLQLQPHFLFNSLNSINAMIMISPDEARQMVQQLSDFLRNTLRRADEHWMALAEEWGYLQLYLAIEKVRFGHRLEVETDWDKQTNSWIVPTLLLQPLVENAIKFGLYGTTDKVIIHIGTSIQDGMLQIRITNPFDSDMQPPQGSGFGLNGLRRRLYLLFARNDLLETKIDNNLFSVILKLPPKYD